MILAQKEAGKADQKAMTCWNKILWQSSKKKLWSNFLAPGAKKCHIHIPEMSSDSCTPQSVYWYYVSWIIDSSLDSKTQDLRVQIQVPISRLKFQKCQFQSWFQDFSLEFFFIYWHGRRRLWYRIRLGRTVLKWEQGPRTLDNDEFWKSLYNSPWRV